MMPTGCKLVSAVYFAVLGWLLGGLVWTSYVVVKEIEHKPNTSLNILMAFIGILVGWRLMGVRGGQGRNYAIQGGILTAVALMIWTIVVLSIRSMVQQAMKGKYGGNISEAVVSGFQIAIDSVKDYWNVPIVLALVVGGIVGGIVADWAARRWP